MGGSPRGSAGQQRQLQQQLQQQQQHQPSPDAFGAEEVQVLSGGQVEPPSDQALDLGSGPESADHATSAASIPCELTALKAIHDHDGELSRSSRQVVIIVPEGVREDRKVRVLINNMQLELLVPEGAQVGDHAACDLPLVAPLEPARQKKILQEDILMTHLRWFRMEEHRTLQCRENDSLVLPPDVRIKAAWFGPAGDEASRVDVTDSVRRQYDSGLLEVRASSQLGHGQDSSAKVFEVTYAKEGDFVTDEARKQKKLEAYRLLRGRSMGLVLMPIEEREDDLAAFTSPVAGPDGALPGDH